MEKHSVTLSYKQVGVIILLLMNLIIIGPGGWILKTLWSEANTFKTETEDQIEKLKVEIGEVRVEYVTRSSFSGYREQMAKNIRYLDSKVAGMKDSKVAGIKE